MIFVALVAIVAVVTDVYIDALGMVQMNLTVPNQQKDRAVCRARDPSLSLRVTWFVQGDHDLALRTVTYHSSTLKLALRKTGACVIYMHGHYTREGEVSQ